MTTELTFDTMRLPPECVKLREEVRAFLAEEIAAGTFDPHGGTDAYSEEFSRKIGAKGWIGMTWPKEYGGQAKTQLERYVVTEEMLAHKAPTRHYSTADRQSGPVLLRYGHENDSIASKFSRWTIRVMAERDPYALPRTIANGLREIFDVPQAALRVWDVAEQYAQADFARHVGEELGAGGLIGVHVVLQQLGVVVGHLFEVRHDPALVHRIAMKSAGQLVVHAAAGHLFERGDEDLP